MFTGTIISTVHNVPRRVTTRPFMVGPSGSRRALKAKVKVEGETEENDEGGVVVLLLGVGGTGPEDRPRFRPYQAAIHQLEVLFSLQIFFSIEKIVVPIESS